ncbi:MAG: SDR family NAD(P)-dependent oxidoreductase [Salinibacterium amurskyense]
MTFHVAIVTGAGGAIGSATVRELVSHGLHVVAADLRLDHMRKLLRDLAQTSVTLVEANVTSAEDLDAIVTRARAIGPITTLVNAAGGISRGALTEISEDDWDNTLDLCLRAAMRLTKRVLPELVANAPSSIINIASIHQKVLAPRLPAYSAAKAGLVALTQQLAVDYGRLGVRANVVSPGFIATTPDTDTANNEVLRTQLVRATPSPRGGVPNDVASAIGFLASAHAGFVNGAELVIDGGASLVHSLSVSKPELEWRAPELREAAGLDSK